MPFKRLSVASRWAAQGGADGITATAARKIKTSPDNKVMMFVTGTPDGGPSAVGILRRSLDFGITWANSPQLSGCDGCLDFAFDGHQGIWGLFYDSTTPGDPDGYTAKVGYSNDQGATWALKDTYAAGLQAFNIASLPAGTHIAFTALDAQGAPGAAGSNYQLVVSEDSGTTWAVKDVNVSPQDFPDVPLVSWAPGPRLIVYTPGVSLLGGQAFMASVNYGAITSSIRRWNGTSWVEVGTGPTSPVTLPDGFYDTLQAVNGKLWLVVDGYLFRSDDGGATFQERSTGIGSQQIADNTTPSPIAEGPDGTLWLLNIFDEPTSIELLKSVDGGDNWSSVATITDAEIVKDDNEFVVVNPNDADHLIILGGDDAGSDNPPSVLVSVNGGGSFTLVTPSHTLLDGTFQQYQMLAFLSSGRAIFARDLIQVNGPGSADNDWYWGIYISDDGGFTWAESLILINAASAEGEPGSDPGMGPLLAFDDVLFLCGNLSRFGGGTIAVWMSLDEGDSWSLLEVIGQPLGTPVTNNRGGRIAYEPTTDTLYASNIFEDGGPTLLRMNNAKSGSGSWEDISPFTVDPEFPIFSQAVAVT